MKSRMLRQEYFINDKLAVNPLAHLLFLGLLGLADRDGRLEDRPYPIKVQALAYYDCNVDELLDILFASRVINRYEVDGKRYIEIIDFTTHQRVHPKEQSLNIPAPVSIAIPGNSGKLPDVSGNYFDSIGKGISNSISRDKEGECEGKPINTPVDKSPSPKPRKSKQEYAQLPDELPPTVEAARPSLEKWLKWKESRREGYQKIGLDSLITKLAKFESRTIMDAIEDSLSNGYKGLFPEKISRKNSAPFRETQHERNQRILRENHEKYSQPIGTLSTQVLFLSEDK